ncbi:hypothetical protein ACEE77_08330 [Staphylococcus simulans]
MKKLFIPLFSSLLLLTACGNSDESKKETAKNETKTHEKENKKKEKAKEKKNEQNSEQENSESTEQANEGAVNDQENIESSNPQQNTNEQENGLQDSQENIQSQTNQTSNNNQNSNIPNGDAMFGEYKEDGTYCTVGGCLTPEEQKQQEELNYQEMKKYGYSREEYDAIQEEGARLQLQRDNGEISNEEFTQKYIDLYE